MKKLFLALMCLATLTMFTACDENGNGSGKSKAGQWLNTPDQLANYNPTDTVSHCYQLDYWCDGTTIGREYVWMPESAIIFMIKMAMEADYKAHGQYTKKYQYVEVKEPTEESCTSRQWEGAKCWLITYTMPTPEGGTVTDQEYFWAPEENARERWEYYKAHLSEVGLVDYAYEATNINDRDACYAMNPSDPDPVDPQPSTESKCWKVTLVTSEGTTTLYTWAPEAAIQSEIKAAKLSGGDGFYEPSNASDQGSCALLNAAQ